MGKKLQIQIFYVKKITERCKECPCRVYFLESLASSVTYVICIPTEIIHTLILRMHITGTCTPVPGDLPWYFAYNTRHGHVS